MEHATTGDWSLGVLVGAPITIIALVIFALAALIMIVQGDIAATWPIGGLIVTVGIALWAFYPLDAEYHQWREVSGTVASVDSRLLPSGSGMEEKFVVTYDGSDQEYGVEDTRAALVEKGDELTITCKREWQFAGVDGYNCKWVERSS